MTVTTLPELTEITSPEQLARLQEDRIAYQLARARQAPFYAGRLADEGRDHGRGLTGLPMTTKEELGSSYPRGMLAVPMAEVATYFESSGSDGRPTPAFYTEQDWFDLTDRFGRKTIGIDADDVMLVRSPYALGLAAHLAHATSRRFGAAVLPGDNRSSVVPYPRVVRVLHDLGVTLTWSNPTECLLWAATAQRRGLDPARDFPNLRALYVGGEPMSPARRATIARVWQVPVIDEYGCTELGSLAGRCAHDELHLWADRVQPEVYDPVTGTISDTGEGELVVTPLFLQAMPLIRYNLHDWVRVDAEPCRCGWVLPTVSVRGRAEQGYPVGPARVTQIALEQLVFSLPDELGVWFWRARAERDRLHVQIEVADHFRAAARDELTQTVLTTLGVPCEVEALPVGTLVPTDVLVGTAQSLKPRALFGPGESWDQAVVFTAA
ncbi:MAG: phenylacetate--CoA ligase family protein [Propionibacteriaceae bacterium]